VLSVPGKARTLGKLPSIPLSCPIRAVRRVVDMLSLAFR